jgi:hypothetical protein
MMTNIVKAMTTSRMAKPSAAPASHVSGHGRRRLCLAASRQV